MKIAVIAGRNLYDLGGMKYHGFYCNSTGHKTVAI
jgi:hypothetical protein